MVKIIASFMIVALLIAWSIITFVGLDKDERKKFFKQLGFGVVIIVITFSLFFGLTILF